MADRYHRPTRPPTRREVLGPGESRANIDTSIERANDGRKSITSSSQNALPHNHSIVASRRHDVRSSSPVAYSPRNERVAAIVETSQRKAKRNSEISNASTTASSSKRKSFVGRWQLGKTVGKGGCSTVRLVRHKDTGQIGAAKIISRKMAESVRAQSLANLVDVPDRSLQDLIAAGKAMPPPPPGLLREIAIMKLLDHENIVRLYDVWENHNELYLIMEYVEGGELFHYIEECSGLEERESVYIFRQIVVALLYCHRLQIHHRDLKPENILLDRESRKIKLVDFGMAALQPEGKKLTTACGSPHYAAPEVIKNRPYDGAKADVWSCGVILYVMLTGMTPFNYDAERNLQTMYEAIAAADYHMPPYLHPEAQNLIRRIFVPDPRRRISMEEIWEHPFLHKYDHELGYTGSLAHKEAWIGPSPLLDDWTVSREEDIDKEILRNMRTLWHSVPQSLLVMKLLSQEPNQEKYFYAALLKHREETLENYYGGSDAVSYSASDYQHNVRDAMDAPPMPQGKQQSQSQYSIMNDEHLRSSRTFTEPPPSASSYDPYRPSRYRMTQNGASYTKVTVHRRGESNGSKRTHIQHSLRHPNANRVETLRRTVGSRSTSTLGRRSNHRMSMSRSSLTQKPISRHSTTSSIWPSSPPVAVPVRAITSHKRGVSFTRLRRNSTASAIAEPETHQSSHYTPELQAKARFSQISQPVPDTEVQQSPSIRAEHVVRSRKEKAAIPKGRPVTQDIATPSRVIKGDIRKASSELEKACEEAFFRSSVSSSEYTATTERQGPYDTPPSSVSHRDSGNFLKHPSATRPLPSLPVETPNTFIARTLEETRIKLAARSAAEGIDSSAKIQEVLARLDRLMPDGTGAEDRRITSAPDAKPVDSKGVLPIISEENRLDKSHAGNRQDRTRYRSATAPVHNRNAMSEQGSKTVRIVPPSSPIAPSNTCNRVEDYRSQPMGRAGTDSTYLSVPTVDARRRRSNDGVISPKHTLTSETLSGSGDETLAKKKSSWFRRWKEPQAVAESINSQRARTPPAWEELDDRVATKAKPNALVRDKPPAHLNLSQTPVPAPKSSSSSEFPIRRSEDNKGISKWLGKMPWEKKDVDRSPGGAQGNQSFSTRPPSPLLHPATPTTGSETATRSWFARFLRLRPESRTLAFNVPRARARTELFRLLREWQKHGIKDLVYFPQDNAITARVDKINSLDMKPVAFRIELYVVLQNGKKAGLSLARCSQVRGAASSFRQVVEVIERVARERGLLIKDEEKWKELCEILH